MIGFDSNVLVYSVDRDTGERHARAADLIERAIRSGSCIQPLQTMSEFYAVATRKIGLDARTAETFVEGWHAVLPIEPANINDLRDAIRAAREHRLSFWDGMLWATARRLGISLLLSEDFQDGRTLEGVRFVNPFISANDALIDREIGR